jgi:hypothetical protein
MDNLQTQIRRVFDELQARAMAEFKEKCNEEHEIPKREPLVLEVSLCEQYDRSISVDIRIVAVVTNANENVDYTRIRAFHYLFDDK